MENGMLRMKSREVEGGGCKVGEGIYGGGGVERAEVGKEQKEDGETKRELVRVLNGGPAWKGGE